MHPKSNHLVTKASDRELALAAQADCLDAFERLVRRYQAPLTCFLTYYCRDVHNVEDVAQETFLKCFLHIQQFDPDRSFKTWLYTIARRSLPRSVKTPHVSLAQPELMVDKGFEPGAFAESTETRLGLWRIVRNHTTDDEFQLVWLRYAECLSFAEIATIFGETESACKMRLTRTKKKLRPFLKPLRHDVFEFPPQLLNPNSAA